MRGQRWRHTLGLFAVLALTVLPLMRNGSIHAAAPGNQYFYATWARTDAPVQSSMVSRTWMWGPEGFTMQGMEPYQEAPGHWRQVQYFDKSRMEITDPAGDPESPWFVTNGLLVTEMMTGVFQTGHAAFADAPLGPARVNVAGDLDDPTGPTYRTAGMVVERPARALGTIIAERLSRDAGITYDRDLEAYDVIVSAYDGVTDHAIAEPFWDFMNSSGLVYEGDAFIEDRLFENPFYATGRPVTEAYWANVKVAERYRDVLLQCFERRCLTYTPDNPSGWQVEAGNVGLHYYTWRYHLAPDGLPAEGLPLYSSDYEDWTEWPTGGWNAADDRWLGGPSGFATQHVGDYTLHTSGAAGSWIGALGDLPSYDNIIASTGMRLTHSDQASDRGCLLSRVNESNDGDVRLYALCLTTNAQVLAFYYENVDGVQRTDWLIPPGTVWNDRSSTDFNHLWIVSYDHAFWFRVNDEVRGPFLHDAGPLSGAVGVGAQRGTGPAGELELVFYNMWVHQAHE